MFERSYLENIIVNAPVGIITTDMGLRVTFMSESAKIALGLKSEVPIGTVPASGKHGKGNGDRSDPGLNGVAGPCPEHMTHLTSDPDEMNKHLGPVLREEREKSVFEVEIKSGGHGRTVQFTTSLLRDDSYVPIGLLLMCEDVTEERETARKYRNLMENSIDAVFIYKDDSILEVNPAFTRLTGKRLTPEQRLRWEDFIHPDCLEQVVDYAHRRENGDTTVPEKFDCYGLGTDGARQFWRVSVSPVYPDVGIYSVLIHDLTEQKVLQQHLIQTRKMETVSLLAGGIAHDFNNLLTGVLGYSSLIKSVLNPKDQVFSFVDSIESSALHAKELNDQLVAFAQLGKYHVEPVNLNKATENTLRLLRLTINKRIQIKMVFDTELRPIEANATQVQQMITNICINASEAMPDGGVLTLTSKNVVLKTEKKMGNWAIPPGKYVRLTISDSGRGIEKDVIEKVFEPFFSTKGVGFGLGLAAAYGIVKSHKGYIAADSRRGKGTEIGVYFPASKVKKKRESKSMQAAPAGRGRVFVVDDEEVVREILGDILEQLGYEAIMADDGECAIPIYRKEWRSIDIVLLDMIMPGMNGNETFQELKKINPDVKVVVCTGYTEDGPIQDMMKKGALCVLKKPFRMDDIAMVIGETIGVDEGPQKSEARE